MITDKPATEDAFVRAIMPMIGKVAATVWRKHRRYELEDLQAYGVVGALKAYREWEPDGGMAFGAYCFVRIRNAVYDGVRVMAPLSRRVMQRAQRENLALGDIAAEASSGEWATCPEAEAIAHEERAELQRAVARLPRHQARVIRELLLGADQAEVAEASGVSRPTWSREYARGVENLRRLMADAMNGLAPPDDGQLVMTFTVEIRGAA